MVFEYLAIRETQKSLITTFSLVCVTSWEVEHKEGLDLHDSLFTRESWPTISSFLLVTEKKWKTKFVCPQLFSCRQFLLKFLSTSLKHHFYTRFLLKDSQIPTTTPLQHDTDTYSRQLHLRHLTIY